MLKFFRWSSKVPLTAAPAETQMPSTTDTEGDKSADIRPSSTAADRATDRLADGLPDDEPVMRIARLAGTAH